MYAYSMWIKFGNNVTRHATGFKRTPKCRDLGIPPCSRLKSCGLMHCLRITFLSSRYSHVRSMHLLSMSRLRGSACTALTALAAGRQMTKAYQKWKSYWSKLLKLSGQLLRHRQVPKAFGVTRKSQVKPIAHCSIALIQNLAKWSDWALQWRLLYLMVKFCLEHQSILVANVSHYFGNNGFRTQASFLAWHISKVMELLIDVLLNSCENILP